MIKYQCGIDFGTKYSCISIYKSKKSILLANKMGQHITPSYVSFINKELLVGSSAKKQELRNAENTVFDLKKMLGKTFSDPDLKKDKEKWPFDVIQTSNDNLEIKIFNGKDEERFSPEHLVGMLFSYLKNTAEDYLSEKVSNAIIAIPASFNEVQKQSIINAAKIAGLNVQTIREPIAVIYAYNLQKNINHDKRIILIFDFGGGSLDISLIHLTQNVLKIIAIGGDSNLRGEDFDLKIINYLTKIIQKKEGIDPNKNNRILFKLKNESEKIKKILSLSMKSIVEIESLYEGKDFHQILSRACFESMCISEFDRIIIPIKDILKRSQLNRKNIDQIILVGGSSKIPAVKERLKQFFPNKQLLCNLDPETVIAMGASSYAENLNFSKKELKNNQIKMFKIIFCSIGIEIGDGMMYKIIQKNQQIPCKITSYFTTCEDNQKKCLFKIYKGENFFVKDNKILGKFWIKQLPSRPRSYLKIQMTFQLTENGILDLVICEKTSGLKQKFKIENLKERFKYSKISFEKDLLIKKKQKNNLIEQEFYLRKRKRMLLENILYQTKNELGIFIPEVLKKIKDIFVWMHENEELKSSTLIQKLIEFQIFLKTFFNIGKKENKKMFIFNRLPK